MGYFEGVDSERGIAWRVADSIALREFMGYALTDATPDHSTISRNRRLIDLQTHQLRESSPAASPRRPWNAAM